MRNILWVWAPLGVITSALSIVSLVQNFANIDVFAIPSAVLEAYRALLNDIFYISVEWWTGVKLPNWMQDTIALYLLSTAVSLRALNVFDELNGFSSSSELLAGLLSTKDNVDLESMRVEYTARRDLINFRKNFSKWFSLLPFYFLYIVYHTAKRARGLKKIEKLSSITNQSSYWKVFGTTELAIKLVAKQIRNLILLAVLSAPVMAVAFFVWNYLLSFTS